MANILIHIFPLVYKTLTLIRDIITPKYNLSGDNIVCDYTPLRTAQKKILAEGGGFFILAGTIWVPLPIIYIFEPLYMRSMA